MARSGKQLALATVPTGNWLNGVPVIRAGAQQQACNCIRQGPFANPALTGKQQSMGKLVLRKALLDDLPGFLKPRHFNGDISQCTFLIEV
jgi:hypothetical protein